MTDWFSVSLYVRVHLCACTPVCKAEGLRVCACICACPGTQEHAHDTYMEVREQLLGVSALLPPQVGLGD